MADDGAAPEGAAPEGARERRQIPLDNNESQPYVLMEEIIDKLKLLNYETKFTDMHDYKPLTKIYFAQPSGNPRDQFSYFTSLVHWLLKFNKREMTYDQFDDPNSIVSLIVSELKAVNLNLDIAPNKLKQGSGLVVCQVLNQLLDLTIANGHFKFGRPKYPDDAYQEDIQDGDEADLGADIVDDAVVEEEDDYYDHQQARTGEDDYQEKNQIIESNVDPVIWKEELERVIPQLKVVVSSEQKDWRSHVESIKRDQSTINDSIPHTKTQLERIAQEVEDSLEKIENRERRFNEHCNSLIEDYRNEHRQLEDVQSGYKRATENINLLTNDLQQIQEELHDVKNDMDKKGLTMTDQSPLVKIKQALSKLKNETRQMELRIAVVAQTLLSARLKNRNKEADPGADLADRFDSMNDDYYDD